MALTAICVGLLSETMSGDVMFLSLMNASDIADQAGVSRAEYERVQQIVVDHWQRRRKLNPMHKLYDDPTPLGT